MKADVVDHQSSLNQDDEDDLSEGEMRDEVTDNRNYKKPSATDDNRDQTHATNASSGFSRESD